MPKVGDKPGTIYIEEHPMQTKPFGIDIVGRGCRGEPRAHVLIGANRSNGMVFARFAGRADNFFHFKSQSRESIHVLTKFPLREDQLSNLGFRPKKSFAQICHIARLLFSFSTAV